MENIFLFLFAFELTMKMIILGPRACPSGTVARVGVPACLGKPAQDSRGVGSGS